MTRPMTKREPPSREALCEGILGSAATIVRDTDLSHAVGESGLLTLTLTVSLDHGRAQWTKGSLAFERRINLS